MASLSRLVGRLPWPEQGRRRIATMSVAAMTDAPARMPVRFVPADALLHPLAIAALVVLVLNDHVLKDLAPGPLTGKLSDVVGLVVLPLLVLGAWELATATLGRWHEPTGTALIVAIVLAGGAFTAIKMSGDAAEIYRIGMGFARWSVEAGIAAVGGAQSPETGRVRLAQDMSDMICLPALLVAWRVGRSRIGG
jgi:hypothetical protein